MKNKLLTRNHVKKYILENVKTARPGWDCTRVSDPAVDKLEMLFKKMLDRAIHQHPTKGKTFTEVM